MIVDHVDCGYIIQKDPAGMKACDPCSTISTVALPLARVSTYRQPGMAARE